MLMLMALERSNGPDEQANGHVCNDVGKNRHPHKERNGAGRVMRFTCHQY